MARQAQPQHKCTYCRKAFVREASFLVHMCEQKRRWVDRDEKHVRIAFTAYQRFYEVSFRGQKAPTYESFAKNSLYLAFVKFARYVLDINAINMPEFIDFLIKSGLPIDKWQSPVVYETYVRELTKKETADAAAQRNILLMEQWANETGEPWQDFFRKITPELATHYIRSGRISPWVLYTAASAESLFDRLSEEQMQLVKGYIDPHFWKIMLDRHPEDKQWLKQLFEQEGV